MRLQSRCYSGLQSFETWLGKALPPSSLTAFLAGCFSPLRPLHQAALACGSWLLPQRLTQERVRETECSPQLEVVVFLQPNLENDFSHFCRIYFIRGESLSAVHNQGERNFVPSLERRGIKEFVGIALRPLQFVLWPPIISLSCMCQIHVKDFVDMSLKLPHHLTLPRNWDLETYLCSEYFC